MARFCETIADLGLDFRASWRCYKNICERLLRPLSLTTHEVTNLLQEPAGAWSAPRLQEIREHLGEGYEDYLAVSVRLHTRLEQFAAVLGLVPSTYQASHPPLFLQVQADCDSHHGWTTFLLSKERRFFRSRSGGL